VEGNPVGLQRVVGVDRYQFDRSFQGTPRWRRFLIAAEDGNALDEIN